jgi:hypothetical protein
MSMESHGRMILTMDTKEFGEKPILVPLLICLYHVVHKWYSLINVTANYAAWLDGNYRPLCLHQDLSGVRQTLDEFRLNRLTAQNVHIDA